MSNYVLIIALLTVIDCTSCCKDIKVKSDLFGTIETFIYNELQFVCITMKGLLWRRSSFSFTSYLSKTQTLAVWAVLVIFTPIMMVLLSICIILKLMILVWVSKSRYHLKINYYRNRSLGYWKYSRCNGLSIGLHWLLGGNSYY